MRIYARFRFLAQFGMLTNSLLGGVAILALFGCETNSMNDANLDEALLFSKEPVKIERGKASYYYGRWIGRPTANGETYKKEDVTAAHKNLDFGSYVRVHNLANERSIIVRINNRGPYVRGRVIDLSVRAAEHLKMRKAGVIPVRLEVLDPIADEETISRYVTELQFTTNP